MLNGCFLEGLLQGAQSEGFVVKSQFWKRPFLEGLLLQVEGAKCVVKS